MNNREKKIEPECTLEDYEKKVHDDTLCPERKRAWERVQWFHKKNVLLVKNRPSHRLRDTRSRANA